MILFLGGILEVVKEAWHFVESAVRSNVPRQVAEDIITPISDILTERDVDLSYGLYEAAVEAWQKIHFIPDEYLVSTNFAIDTPFDWRREHIMKMRIQGVDINTGQEIDTWITVESDRELSKVEWQNLGQEAVLDSPFGYSYIVNYVSEYEYYTKNLN